MLEKKDIDYFNFGKIENSKFWRRLGGKPNLENKSVLDFGCGHGSLCLDIAKKLGLEAPDTSKWTWKSSNGNNLWQVNATVLDEEPSNYMIFNKFKFSYPDKQKFIENNRAWGELVVKPRLEEVKGLNWAVATLITSSSYKDQESTMFNGISFDGFDSMEQILHQRSYKENGGMAVNPNFQNFQKYVNENELTGFNTAVESSIYEAIDSSWD